MGRQREGVAGADRLSPEIAVLIARPRARAASGADRRERGTELGVSAAFVCVAAAMAVVLPHRGELPLAAAAWLLAICMLLLRIEFEVGEGRTRPVQLVLVPMLVLLPAPVVPLLVAVAHLLARLPDIAARKVGPERAMLSVADSWFAVGPALVVALAGLPGDVSASALGVIAAALAAEIGLDLAVSTVRLRLGLGIDIRSQLRLFGWVYLVDVLLTPIAVLAAVVSLREPLAAGAVLPLAALLAVFAGERRGRIENALELHRMARESEARLQSIVQNSSDLIAILERDGRIRTLTGSVAPLFGPEWRDALGTSLLDRAHPDDVPLLAAFLAGIAAKGADEPQELEWRLRRQGGSWRHVETVATNLLGDPRLDGIVLTARDVDERKAFEEQLRHRAFHDALTGLANRALFYDRIEHAVSRGARADAQVAVLFVDLDDFKAANDARGHAEGDRLLQEVARRLTACLRSADTAARLGGDEFGVLLEGITDAATVTATAARMLEALAQPIELAAGPVAVSASIGIAISTHHDRGVEEFLRKADLAMYEAKRNGKRRAELYHPDLERLDAPDGPRGQWFARNDEHRAEIDDVLADPDGITMVFQPIIDLRTGRIAGYESLSRFNREPRRGPDVWFAQAHRCGLGYALEARAIATALATPGRPNGTYLTFNLSPSSLLSDEILRVLPDRLDGLVVEITENELVSGDPAITHALDDLRARGARLAVDDTGAGYAGLAHVMRLRPDIIKLDRALITGVDSDPAKAPLISSFVRYARDIDATVCAEGVETLQELECLADLDVAYGQGYGIARPSAPWSAVAPEATAACLQSFKTTLADAHDTPSRADHDRRLEVLARRLATITTGAELEACLLPVARELQADEVRLVGPNAGDHGATQLLADDPDADPETTAALRAEGFASRLTLPISHGGEIVGHLEAYAHDQRPWSRFQVGRARLICYQLGPLLHPQRAATNVA
jgi:diguanylate cyclase (GGDEF)-like protein/PAS domain S-box-containing protein